MNLLALLLLVAGAGNTEPYQWPLKLPPVLTSSFGEYREGRFHAGIDIRTDGVTGKDVHAASHGYISRIRCSPYGYGKALYVRFDDGNTAVYAHLDKFRQDIREYVYAAQHRRQRYSIDLYPTPDLFPVARGDLLAKSGQTGVGVPHLHFEIRDRTERPMNPRLADLTWPDTTPPKIRKVLVMAKGPDSRVNGDWVPLVLKPKKNADGVYLCETVRAHGIIGFGIEVTDPSNGGRNRLGIYSVETTAGDDTLFIIKNDAISYDNMHDGAVAFHPFLEKEGRFLLQWRWPGNDVAPFQWTQQDGWMEVTRPREDVVLTVKDFWGNESRIVIPVQEAHTEKLPAPTPTTDGKGNVSIQCMGAWLLITAAFQKPESEKPLLRIDGAPALEGGKFERVSPTTFRAGYSPAADGDTVVFKVLHERLPNFENKIHIARRGERQHVITSNDVRVHVRPDSPYGTMYMRVEAVDLKTDPKIPLVGGPYKIWPEQTPLDAPVRLSFPLTDTMRGDPTVHVYRKSAKGWLFEGGKMNNNRLSISTHSFGTFALFQDDAPPTISFSRPLQGAVAPSRRPTIRASVRDVGSGIDAIEGRYNGQWLIIEYDPEQGLLKWAKDHDLPQGEGEIVLRVTDGAGNTAAASRHMIIP